MRSGNLGSAIAATLFLLVLPELTGAGKRELLDANIRRGKTATGFRYMTGGLVFDERQLMERQSASYNLKLIFAAQSRILLSPVLLLIGDNQGRRVDKIIVRDPWFYIQLPSGAYTIVARMRDKVVLLRDVYLRENRRATYFVRGH